MYEVENTNIINSIFEIFENRNENVIHIIMETLFQLNKLSPLYA